MMMCHHAAAAQVSRCASTTVSNNDAPPCVSLSFQENGVAILTLCNPERRNALTVSMMEDLDRHVQTLAKWSSSDGNHHGNSTTSNRQCSNENDSSARIVVLTGMNGTFCSGLDLHDNGNSTDDHLLKEGRNMVHHMTRVTNQLHSLPVLSVSAIDGYAVGGGAELTTCTDLVVLSRTAQVKFVHSKRGASPGWGGGRRLVKKVGRQRALRMLLLGETVTGEQESKSTGGVLYSDAVAEEGESALDATMRLIVHPILQLPCSKSIRAIKKAVSAADGDGDIIDLHSGLLELDKDAAVRGEIDSFISVWGGDSNLEQIKKAKERLRDKNTKP